MFISSVMNGNAFSLLMFVPYFQVWRIFIYNLWNATFRLSMFPLRFSFFVCLFVTSFFRVITISECQSVTKCKIGNYAVLKPNPVHVEALFFSATCF